MDLSLSFDLIGYRRIIADKEVVVHCHHYNARLQYIIEGASHIDGKRILRDTTEEIFVKYLLPIFSPTDSYARKWGKAVRYYSHMGFGTLDISALDRGIITSPESHFVEGWRAGFQDVNRTVCTFTEGYLQAAIYAITGKAVTVREKVCLACGEDACRFIVDENRVSAIPNHQKQIIPFRPKSKVGYLKSDRIDEEKIIQTIVDMPFHGNEDGLLPAFNVYLANMPADFYSLLCNSYIQEMEKINMQATAKILLIYAGEICALNTLRGIKASIEWAELVQPMIKEASDNLHGLIAVTNALGWGNWHVKAFRPGESLELEALNGYEALGSLAYRGYTKEGYCYMLTGVAAGIMALLYRDGTVDERLGSFQSVENSCICTRDDVCHFSIEAL